MVTSRHKIILSRLRGHIGPEELQHAKLIGVFFLMFGIISFFTAQIISSLNEGIDTSNRVETIEKQVARLEKENTQLESELNVALSETEIEAQYRALGYRKPDESVYIVNKNPIITPTPEIIEQTNESPYVPNWQKWVLLIFN